jgi:hypothetical protein
MRVTQMLIFAKGKNLLAAGEYAGVHFKPFEQDINGSELCGSSHFMK